MELAVGEVERVVRGRGREAVVVGFEVRSVVGGHAGEDPGADAEEGAGAEDTESAGGELRPRLCVEARRHRDVGVGDDRAERRWSQQLGDRRRGDEATTGEDLPTLVPLVRRRDSEGRVEIQVGCMRLDALEVEVVQRHQLAVRCDERRGQCRDDAAFHRLVRRTGDHEHVDQPEAHRVVGREAVARPTGVEDEDGALGKRLDLVHEVRIPQRAATGHALLVIFIALGHGAVVDGEEKPVELPAVQAEHFRVESDEDVVG